jgi:TonB family protein
MKTSNTAANNIAFAIPFETLIYTAEMKNYIGKSTVRGLFISITMITVLVAAFLLFMQTKDIIIPEHFGNGFGPIPITNYDNLDRSIEIPNSIPETEIIFGIKDRAGNPIPVPDAIISPDAGEFAKLDDLSKALHQSGNTLGNPNLVSGNQVIDVPKMVYMQPVSKEDEEPGYKNVDKDPGVDLERLEKLVIYPKLARDAKIEGKVTVGILVSKTGFAMKYMILDSENELLNDAALSAVKAYGKFEPAIQASIPVACWVYIPIHFRLK